MECFTNRQKGKTIVIVLFKKEAFFMGLSLIRRAIFKRGVIALKLGSPSPEQSIIDQYENQFKSGGK